MNYNQTKETLGSFVNDVEVAKSYQNRKDVISKIVTYIKNQGLDVDDSYIEFINNYQVDQVPVEVTYLPIYFVTSIARLYWKDKDEEKTEHQEFIKFQTAFYANDKNGGNRLNNLDAMSIIDKDVMKQTKKTSVVDNINTSLKDENIKLLGTTEHYEVQVVLDAPKLSDNDMYPIESSYILNESEIDKHIENALKETKSYQRLQKMDEKVSKIEQKSVEVVLVPIAKIVLGKHHQYVNCANGKIDVKYEKSKQISKNLNFARAIVYPSIFLFLASDVTSFIFKWNTPVTIEKGLPHLFGNIFDILWFVFTFIGVIVSIIAIPKRESIVKRANANKDRLKINRELAKILLADSVILVVILLIAVFGN
jgi:hypothetical protein